MTTSDVDGMLRERFSNVAYSADRSDWSDVRSRAETILGTSRPAARPPRRYRSLAFAAAAAMLAIFVAAPALGIPGRVVNLFTAGERAPDRTAQEFATLDVGAPAGMETRVIAGTARKALEAPLPGGAFALLWVAPTATGGFCDMVEVFNDARIALGRGGPGCDSSANATGTGVVVPGSISNGRITRGPVVIYGHATVPEAVNASLRYEDGETVTVALNWISKPIDAGFFVLGVPETKWSLGHLPAELQFVDGDGRPVDRPKQIGLAKILGSTTPNN